LFATRTFSRPRPSNTKDALKNAPEWRWDTAKK